MSKATTQTFIGHMMTIACSVNLPCMVLYCSAGPCSRWPSCRTAPGCSTAAYRSSCPPHAAGLPSFRSPWSGKQASGSSTLRAPDVDSAGLLWSLPVVRHLNLCCILDLRSQLHPQQQSGLKGKERKKIMDELKKKNLVKAKKFSYTYNSVLYLDFELGQIRSIVVQLYAALAPI